MKRHAPDRTLTPVETLGPSVSVQPSCARGSLLAHSDTGKIDCPVSFLIMYTEPLGSPKHDATHTHSMPGTREEYYTD
jgi:hypothetical protein